LHLNINNQQKKETNPPFRESKNAIVAVEKQLNAIISLAAEIRTLCRQVTRY
jgi:hypothetical protein